MLHAIAINGKEVLVRFGRHLQEKMFVGFENGERPSSLSFMLSIIYYGNENWGLGADKAPVVSKSEVFNWLEDIYTDETRVADRAECDNLMDAYNGSAIAKRIAEANKASNGEGDEGAKKKLPLSETSPGEKSELLPQGL